MSTARPNATDAADPDLDDPHVRQLIRHRFYQWALDQADGNAKRLNWPRVADILADRTGVRIAHETLRQNFRPSSKKRVRPPKTPRNAANWRAIYRFLISDAVAYLHPSELRPGDAGFAAFAGLQAFVDPQGVSRFPPQLAGRFSNLWLDGADGAELLSLDFSGAPAGSVARVALRLFDEDEFLEGESDGGLSYFGGAVHRADGCVVAIVREAFSGEVRFLSVMQTRPALREADRIDDLVIASYAGLSPVPLKRADTADRDESLAEPGTRVTHSFKGGVPIVFLTRS